MVWSNRVKMFMDGVLESYTAFMLRPYPGKPENHGEEIFAAEHFNRACITADKLGLQISVHAVGDGAVRRVLVIDAPEQVTEDHRRQLASLDAAKAGLEERDVLVVTRPGSPAFRVRLVGKDGGVKLDQGAPIETATLFALIDAMPMRRAEMAGRQGGGEKPPVS